MIKMGYEERQIIKKVIEQNLQRPLDIATASVAAKGRYLNQVQRAIELFSVVIDNKQPIFVMANTSGVCRALEESLKRINRRQYKLRYVHDRHSLAGMGDCVVINVIQQRPCDRYDAERQEMLDYVKTCRGIDFWTFGDF